MSVTNSLAKKFPQVARQWHPTKNESLTPDQVVYGSNKRVWWQCDQGPDHEWQSTIQNKTTAGRGCPFCANQKVSVTNSLAALEPDLSMEWHPEKTTLRWIRYWLLQPKNFGGNVLKIHIMNGKQLLELGLLPMDQVVPFALA